LEKQGIIAISSHAWKLKAITERNRRLRNKKPITITIEPINPDYS
jgi:hypothetical protein